MAIFEYNSIKTKKTVAIVLFLLYIGSISLLAQNTPQTYVAQKTSETLIIDGKMDESSWNKAKWTNNFIDIEGCKKPIYTTKVKMIWDESYLYFFAELKEPHVWATLKQKDTIIFYNNDFDANGNSDIVLGLYNKEKHYP
ncbi:Carbohydrate family 9 binding domain-like [Maribacter orientalis]|uniref:Carbohydrate family 9 binding domain-like n=1 Tax=Maribacter orientalis TaxID=228957 RepID=A0A1H7RC20_9FLAO|nr:carbohydrate-binding family 9-like protein [Maribacter orientalis]SEL56987.1 Carbohydrate family 9 binding domain-like [Maribacter orientalis]